MSLNSNINYASLLRIIKELDSNISYEDDDFKVSIEKNESPNVIYHYTSLTTFQSIIDSVFTEDSIKQLILRATQIEYLNDDMEFNKGAELLTEIIENYEVKNEIPQGNRKSHHITVKNWKEATRFGKMFSSPFIVSFSENRDNLPMWNTYGNNGFGVALGFDKELISDLKTNQKTHNPELFRCIYNYRIFRESLEPNSEKLFKIMRFNEDSTQYKHTMNTFSLGTYVSRLKSPHYQYEKEWRLINMISKKEKSNFIKTVAMNGIIKPFIEVPLPISALKEIVIGALC